MDRPTSAFNSSAAPPVVVGGHHLGLLLARRLECSDGANVLNEPLSTTPVSVVRRAIEALNRGDIDAAVACCAEDVVVWAPGHDLIGQQLQGHDELRSMLEFSEVNWPDLWTGVVSFVASEERVAVEMTVSVTESGHRISQPMAAFYRVRDGLIVEQRSYYDLGALQRFLLRNYETRPAGPHAP